MSVLTPTDLFTAGLGAEVAGAVLLAKGLLLSPSQLVARSRSFWSYSPTQIIGLVDDRVEAVFGVIGIGAGFLAQLTGYFVIVADPGIPSGGAARAAISALTAIASAVLVAGPWFLLRSKLRMNGIVKVARAATPASARGLPDAHLLAAVAQEMGEGRTMTRGIVESDKLFSQRVFNVDVADEDPAEMLRNLNAGQPSG
jgi:hypothetical protein